MSLMCNLLKAQTKSNNKILKKKKLGKKKERERSEVQNLEPYFDWIWVPKEGIY